jgi:hypothetical protein
MKTTLFTVLTIFITIHVNSIAGSAEGCPTPAESDAFHARLARAEAREVRKVQRKIVKAKSNVAAFLKASEQLKGSPQKNNATYVQAAMKAKSVPIKTFNNIFKRAFPYSYNPYTEVDIKPALTYAAANGLPEETHLVMNMDLDLDLFEQDAEGNAPLDKVSDLAKARLKFLESLSLSELEARDVDEFNELQQVLSKMQKDCRSLISHLHYRKIANTVHRSIDLPDEALEIITEYIDKNDGSNAPAQSGCAIL